MRTLGEIIESALSGEMPTHEECYWAMLAIRALGFFDRQALKHLADVPEKLRNPTHDVERSFTRWKMALGKNPKEYIGWDNDPSNPEYQRFRGISVKLAEKVLERVNARHEGKDS